MLKENFKLIDENIWVEGIKFKKPYKLLVIKEYAYELFEDNEYIYGVLKKNYGIKLIPLYKKGDKEDYRLLSYCDSIRTLDAHSYPRDKNRNKDNQYEVLCNHLYSFNSRSNITYLDLDDEHFTIVSIDSVTRWSSFLNFNTSEGRVFVFNKKEYSERYVKLLINIYNSFYNNIFKNDFKAVNTLRSIMNFLADIIFIRENNKRLYDRFYIPKHDGTQREINAPIDELKNVLGSMNNSLNKLLEQRIKKYKTNNIIAYRNEKSIKDNAAIHKDNDIIIKFDISKFFENCHYKYWIHNFSFIYAHDKEIEKEVLLLFKDLIYDRRTNGLYMGSPVSPTISNLLLVPVVKIINNVLKGINPDIKFSIYADDITFSYKELNEEFNPTNMRKLVEYAFRKNKYRFKLKEEKTLVMKKNKRKITGISVNHHNQLTISQRKYRKLRMDLMLINKGVKIEDLQGFNNSKEFFGLLNFYTDIDETGKIKKLCQKYNIKGV